MREIKFRFYDKTLSKMLYRSLLPYDNEHPEIEVMQFTGLIDKNGKEVFEGDIIKWKTTRYHTKQQEENQIPMPKFFISPVLFHEGCFLVNESDEVSLDVETYDTFLSCFFSDSMDNKFDFKAEIIGNIYENPELLKR